MNRPAPALSSPLSFPQWEWPSFGQIPPFSLLLHSSPGAWSFALRTSLAAVLSLLVAFFLQLESPFWATTTVFIVANPVRGKVLSKSLFRLFGTAVGATVAVVLTAFFAQTPELYLLSLALWIGLCTGASSLLQRFHSYGTVLAGYTAAIVGLFVAIHTPLQVFDNALARVAAITVGIVSSAVVSALFGSGGAAKDFELRMRSCSGEMASLISELLERGPFSRFVQAHRKLALQVVNAEEIIESATYESASASARETSARLSVIHFMHGMTALGALAHNLEKISLPLPPALDEARQQLEAVTLEFSNAFHRPQYLSSGEAIRQCGERLRRLKEELSANPPVNALPIIACVERIAEVAAHMELALLHWEEFQRPTGKLQEKLPPVSYHRDYQVAATHAVRSFLAVFVTSIFWIATASQWGEQLVFVTAANCSLICARPNPAAACVGFFYGTFWMLPVCFIFAFFVMPYLGAPLLLALVMGAIFVPGCLAMASASPLVAATGTFYVIFFINQLMPLNHTRYNVISFLSSGLMLLGGHCATVGVFRIILPVDSAREVRRLMKTLLRETQSLARHDLRSAVRSEWETRMYDRLLRLVSHVNPSGERSERMLRGAFASLQIGTDILRLRGLLEKEILDAEIRGIVLESLRAMSQIERDFEGNLNRLGDALLRLSELQDTSAAMREDRWLAVASLHELVHLLTHYHDLFQSVSESPKRNGFLT